MKLLKKLVNSFKYAFRGILFCINHETNMRIHIVAAVFVFYISLFYSLSKEQYILLILTCLAVIGTEMLNTAIEVVIDKVSPGYSALAKVGKDVAAGAVFLSAVSAVIIGFILFWDTDTFVLIYRFFSEDLGNFAMLLAYIVLSYLFVAKGKKRNIKGKIQK